MRQLCAGHTLSLQSKASLSLWSTSGGMLTNCCGRTFVQRQFSKHISHSDARHEVSFLVFVCSRSSGIIITLIISLYLHIYKWTVFFFVKCKCHFVTGDIMMQFSPLVVTSRNVAVALIASSAAPNGQLYAGVFQGDSAVRREILHQTMDLSGEI